MGEASFGLVATVLGSPNPQRLAEFYQDLLGWTITYSDQTWVKLRPDDGSSGLSFQLEPDFAPAAWPHPDGAPALRMHLDIVVDDLAGAVVASTQAGARLEDHQPQPDVRVMRDPDGHLFCLFER